MPRENTQDTSSSAVRASPGIALLLIDLVNDMSFDGGDELRVRAEPAIDAVLRLRDEADALELPVIYVNDNHGQWREEHSRIVAHCLRDDSPARDLVRRIAPRPQDYFVVKPHLSGFYATSLPVLLPRLGVGRLILVGVATDICVLFTAADAHMRAYDLWIPGDAVASEGDDRTRWALDVVRQSMGAETRPVAELSMAQWREAVDAKGPKAEALA